jgi:hypothetical protein
MVVILEDTEDLIDGSTCDEDATGPMVDQASGALNRGAGIFGFETRHADFAPAECGVGGGAICGRKAINPKELLGVPKFGVVAGVGEAYVTLERGLGVTGDL